MRPRRIFVHVVGAHRTTLLSYVVGVRRLHEWQRWS